jgi:outer membrane murein-binding lipoprotein Lpp
MRRVLPIVAALFVLAPAPAAHAQSGVGLAVARDFQADGQIDPCAFSTAELQAALDALSVDVKQYGADLLAAIRAAIAARARGDCDDPGTEPVAPSATPPPIETPTPEPALTAVPMKTVVEAPPGPDTDLALAPATATTSLDAAAIGPTSNDIPTPLLLLGLLVLLSAAGAAAVKGGRRVGVAEGPLAPVRHAWREAAWRFGGNWETFRDWVRLGR